MISMVVNFADKVSKERFWKILKTLKETKYAVEIKQYRQQRSTKQNSYYHAVIVKMLAAELGCFPEEMHETLKIKFRPKEIVIKKTGECFTVGKSTTEDDTFDAEQYYETIRIWALQELDILLPLPNEILTE